MSYDVNDFESEVIANSHEQPVVVDFWAEWCGPCRTLGPILEQLEATDARWRLAKVDVDQHQAVAQQYGVRGIPSVKLFVNGEIVAEFTGALPESQVANWLAEHLPNEQKAQLSAAMKLLADGDREGALAALESLAFEPDAPSEAKIFLAQVLVLSEPGRAVELVEDVRTDDDNIAIANDVRVLGRVLSQDADELDEHTVKSSYIGARDALAAGDFASALDGFISVLSLNRRYDDEGARKVCIAIFNMLGREHEISIEYRRAFQSALN
ncbi:MAG: thioredoxin [Gammaproteobacteria bacterium]|nr:thioredoxin [Gammaproteobacteria bacterium]